MIELIKSILTTFPPESTAALVIALFVIIGWFIQSSLKWFLKFNAERQDKIDNRESKIFENTLKSREKEIEAIKEEKKQNKESMDLLQRTYESVKQLNENNTGITREEFENLNKKVRDVDNLTRQELNELREKVNRMLGRLDK
jgi:predicted ribosome quality control (RQC) complex YloA/Tae2 family protein